MAFFNDCRFGRCTLLRNSLKFSHMFLCVFTFFLFGVAYTAPQRIISLAPNLTEILFAIGAGKDIVGTSIDSTYPAAAKKIPIVDDAGQLNLEAIVAAKPTLIIAWRGGNPEAQLRALRQLKIPIVSFRFKKISDIPKAMLQLGQLTKHQSEAQQQVERFNNKLNELKHSVKHPVKVLYVLWQDPLMTVGKHSLITQAIEFCGGENIFSDINLSAPEVSIASVLKRDPQIIISGMNNQHWRNFWRVWPKINAVKNHRLDFINPNLLQRPGPRFIEGLEDLCQKLRLKNTADSI